MVSSLNTGSILETLKELRRWEQTTSSIEKRLEDVRVRRSSVRDKLRALEQKLLAMDQQLTEGSPEKSSPEE